MMKINKIIGLGLLFLLFALKSNAIDLTITVTSIPLNTPVNDNIYISGNFNNWSIGNTNYILQPQANGHRTITLVNVSGTIEFKFNRGSWDYPEATSSGNFLPNRTYNTANGSELFLTIAGWEDLTGNSGSTANANVQILSNSFNMPELNRNRRIWLYLPNDYNTANNKSYPVIYMHDGQNLFDQATSFTGEWEVDETLTNLQNQGGYGAIVVGIDNGGANRINEYSPWVNAQYGGGQGDQYIDFIKNTLKPHIDENYRTLTEPQNTGLIGSSMGGLISLYGVAKFPETFGKGGIFSPSIWFAGVQVVEFINSKNFSSIPLRLYFVGGTNESSTMVSNMQAARTQFINSGVPSQEINLVTHPDGAHSEWYWRREFGAAYQFLFPAPYFATSTLSPSETVIFSIYPNPSKDSFMIECNHCKTEKYELVNLEGKTVLSGQINNANTTIATGDINKGVYLFRLIGSHGISIQKLVIQ